MQKKSFANDDEDRVYINSVGGGGAGRWIVI